MVNLPKTALRALRHRDISTFGLCLVIVLVCIFLISLPVCSWSQKQIMEKFHLKTDNFVRWSLMQFIPSMYSFSNEVWMSIEPVFEDFERNERAFNDIYVHYWINHYPLRYASFSLKNRQAYARSGRLYYIYIRSSYRDSALTSIYHLIPNNNSLYLEKIE
jgi:hypothetical protein